MSKNNYYLDLTSDEKECEEELRDYSEEALTEKADALLEELASSHMRNASRMSTISLSEIFELVAEYSRSYPSITSISVKAPSPMVSVSMHDLYFAVATAIHYLGLLGRGATLSTEHDNEPAILLTVNAKTATEEEAIAAFGLDTEMRFALLTRLAECGGFTLSPAAGQETSLRFLLSRAPAGLLRFCNASDPTLLAAFMLPLTYFHY